MQSALTESKAKQPRAIYKVSDKIKMMMWILAILPFKSGDLSINEEDYDKVMQFLTELDELECMYQSEKQSREHVKKKQARDEAKVIEEICSNAIKALKRRKPEDQVDEVVISSYSIRTDSYSFSTNKGAQLSSS